MRATKPKKIQSAVIALAFQQLQVTKGVLQGISLENSHHNATAPLFQTLYFKDPECGELRPTGSAVDLYGMFRGHGCKPTMIHIEPERSAFC
jgi:hypothetical protein